MLVAYLVNHFFLGIGHIKVSFVRFFVLFGLLGLFEIFLGDFVCLKLILHCGSFGFSALLTQDYHLPDVEFFEANEADSAHILVSRLQEELAFAAACRLMDPQATVVAEMAMVRCQGFVVYNAFEVLAWSLFLLS